MIKKVEIEIDDDVLDAIDKAGFVVVRYGRPKSGEWVWSAWFQEPTVVVGTSNRKHHYLIVEPKPADSIPFPDWVPAWANEVTIDKEGEVKLHDEAITCPGRLFWTAKRQLLLLTATGLPVDWVPAMPNGDWTKAKWRRRK